MRRLALVALVAAACASEPARSPRPLPPPTPSGRAPLRVPGPLSPRIANYRIEARLDVGEKRLTATQTLRWRHTGVAPVQTVPLHLYMNAFKNETSVFMRESRGRHRSSRLREGRWGWIEVSSIRLAGSDVELRPRARHGEDETTLEVPLPAPVAPGEEVTLEMAFSTQLPEVFARTGWKGDFLMVAQWFPKVGVLVVADGAQRWHCETFHLNSEFFADFGVYDVVLDVPDTHVVVATGVLTAVDAAGEGRRRLTFRAEDVHDFAWMADPYMQVLHGVADGDVDVYVVHRPEQAAFAPRHLEAAIRTVETFGRLFYRYPWPSMTVIDPPPAAGGAAGMEYPMIVTTAADHALTPPGVHLPEFVTVHEVGHNWFQGILASNEVDEAWLDEGLNEYADGIVLEEWKGADRSAIDRWGLRVGHYALESARGDLDELVTPIATRSYDFPTFAEYGAASYSKTAAALKTLEHVVGRDRFLLALGLYARRFAFTHPTREDLFATLEEALGQDVRWFLEPAFLRAAHVDFRVRVLETYRHHPPRGVFGEGDGRETRGEEEAPDTGEWGYEVLVVNQGEIPVPVEIELLFEDGAKERRAWDGRARWTRLEGTRPARLLEVAVDPDGKVVLEKERLENRIRRVPSRRAAWRAAARAGFWQQTLLQLWGL